MGGEGGLYILVQIYSVSLYRANVSTIYRFHDIKEVQHGSTSTRPSSAQGRREGLWHLKGFNGLHRVQRIQRKDHHKSQTASHPNCSILPGQSQGTSPSPRTCACNMNLENMTSTKKCRIDFWYIVLEVTGIAPCPTSTNCTFGGKSE